MFGSRTLLIITIVALALLLSVRGHFGRQFVGETDILVLPKSLQAIQDTDRIIADAEKVPQALAFYDKLLEKNQDIPDRFSGLSGATRKAAWNDYLSVERRGKSSVLAVKALDEEEGQAGLVSQRAAEDIIVVMGRYYAIPADLDIHIMDGTTVTPAGNFSGFDPVTVVGSTLILLGIIILILSASSARPELSVPSMSSFGFKREKAESRAAVPATEEEIRNKLSELLEKKI